ncbi:unnamed protein product [Caenorhabditis auriculariae]|uniref:SAND domain-containing protein n=1 Tax=Caenorhabditis auriculariae TaxID=2777116 RepID=A0A8S1H1J5_9PELO|nr:unnamed protein product [Caenorhabditis auriculariae]
MSQCQTDVILMPPEVTEDENGGDLIIKSSPNAKVIEVKCGPLLAKMHVELFICPGIHQQCIELDGDMITPKEFTVRANKDKQKDWKGSIRIGKSNLRTLMEMRSFDFYNHSQFCSAKCQSRNYITPKERDVDRDSRRGSSSSLKGSQLPQMFPSTMLSQSSCGMGLFKDATSFSQLMQLSGAFNNNNNNKNNTEDARSSSPSKCKEELVDVDDSMSPTSSPRPPTFSDVEQLSLQMTNEPCSFWSEMVQVGLADSVIDQMVDALQLLRDNVKTGAINNVAPLLSRTIASLGMCDKVVSLVRRRNSVSSAAKHRLSTDYSTVEDNLFRKRSLDAVSCTSTETPEVKRPCVQYPLPFATNPLQEAMDPKLIAALVQAQLQQMQSQPLDILMQLANLPQTRTTVPHLPESLLAIK